MFSCADSLPLVCSDAKQDILDIEIYSEEDDSDASTCTVSLNMSFESVDDASIMDANNACQDNYTGRRNSDGSTGTFSLTASLESVNNESAMNANNACQERDTSRIDSDEEENRDVFESVNDVDDASTKDANTCNACQERDTGKNEYNEEKNTCREYPTPMNHQKIVRFSSDDLVESVDDASTKDANTACQESDTDKIDNGEEKVIKPKPMRSIILSLPLPPRLRRSRSVEAKLAAVSDADLATACEQKDAKIKALEEELRLVKCQRKQEWAMAHVEIEQLRKIRALDEELRLIKCPRKQERVVAHDDASTIYANNACQERNTDKIDIGKEEDRDLLESVDDESIMEKNNPCHERDTDRIDNREVEGSGDSDEFEGTYDSSAMDNDQSATIMSFYEMHIAAKRSEGSTDGTEIVEFYTSNGGCAIECTSTSKMKCNLGSTAMVKVIY